MMKCLQCSSKIEEDGQYYLAGEMGPELIAVLEQSLGNSFDKNGHICCQCFSSITKLLPSASQDSDNDTSSVTSSVSIKSESMNSDDGCVMPETFSTLPVINEASRECVNCQSSLYGKRCQLIPDGEEKDVIAKMISPKQNATDEPTPGASEPKKCRTVYPPTFLSSPMRKRPKNLPLTSNEKTIALNVYKLIHRINKMTYPFRTDTVAQVAVVMGTSTKTISRVLSEYRKTGRVSSPPPRKPKTSLVDTLDEVTVTKIKEIVHQFDVNNEIFTLNKLVTAVREDEDLPKLSRTALHKLLKKLNVKFQKSNRKLN